MWSVEPETELLTLYQGVTYTTFAALGGAWPAAAPKSSTEITTCAPHEEKSTTEPRPVPAVEAQRTVNSEGTRTFVFFFFLFESCRGVCFARWWCVSQRAPVTPRERAMSMF